MKSKYTIKKKLKIYKYNFYVQYIHQIQNIYFILNYRSMIHVRQNAGHKNKSRSTLVGSGLRSYHNWLCFKLAGRYELS